MKKYVFVVIHEIGWEISYLADYTRDQMLFSPKVRMALPFETKGEAEEVLSSDPTIRSILKRAFVKNGTAKTYEDFGVFVEKVQRLDIKSGTVSFASLFTKRCAKDESVRRTFLGTPVSVSASNEVFKDVGAKVSLVSI